MASTLSMTSGWQISTSTMIAVLPDPLSSEALPPESMQPELIEAPEQETASDHLAVPDTGPASILGHGSAKGTRSDPPGDCSKAHRWN